MDIPKELLETIDPVLTPIYVELFDDCALVVFKEEFAMFRQFEKIDGKILFESVFQPIYFRRN